MNFLYGDETPSWKSFFHIAAIRLTVGYPIVAAISISVADVFAALILFFWILSGHWKERFDLIKRSPLILASLPFVALTFGGVLRDCITAGGFQFDSLRYWWGHYPLFFILILATLFSKKETRRAAFSAINLAIVLIGILVILFWTNLIPVPYQPFRLQSFNIYRNSICFGMCLVLWTGLWICAPFTSKDIPLVRRFLPLSLLIGMKRAARTLLLNLFYFRQDRFRLSTLFFTLLRWGIVVFVCYYLFWLNSSRTAQLSFLAAISVVLVNWNWKKGSLLAAVLCISICTLAHYNSPVFEKKAIRTINDVIYFVKDIFYDTDIYKSGDRLTIWKNIFPSICKKPVIGYGMDLGRNEVKTVTGFTDPHNEFINITLEFGLIGLVCFLFWLAFLFYRIKILPLQWRYLGMFVATALVIDCMNNCALSYNRESHLFCILLAFLFVVDQKA